MADGIDAAVEEWDAGLSTGVNSLDDQHRALFTCVNLLAEATAERSMLRTFYVLEQLSHYVQTHFAEEERYMRIYAYPGLEDHVREHRAFANRLHELRRTYLERDISTDLVSMLREWLKDHVAVVDMAYVPYLKGEPLIRAPGAPAPVAFEAASATAAFT